MRIAQVAPLSESVPPALYGGTERIVSYLTEELVRQGHDVTLYASGDSRTLARLRPVCERALRLDPACRDPLPWHLLALERVMSEASEFDVLHFHHDFLHFPLVRRLPVPSITTLHNRIDLADVLPLYREYADMPLVSISAAQRRPAPWLNWFGTVYHGVPDGPLPYAPEGGPYLAFLGRMSREKRPDLAIRIAREAGLDIRLAAKVGQDDEAYFKDVVQPLLGQPGVEFVGEISEAEKGAFLGGARGLLFPIDWPEPFGLVMIEAMACGTPVIARRAGSVPEVVEDGVSGFIVDDDAQAVAAVARLGELDRRRVRERFESRFSLERMVGDYLALYEAAIERRRVAFVPELGEREASPALCPPSSARRSDAAHGRTSVEGS